jgi:hypothetical protein
MTEILAKMWRWFTLADAPVNRVKPRCSRCDKPSVCLVYLSVNGNTTTRHDCMTHSGGSLTIWDDA